MAGTDLKKLKKQKEIIVARLQKIRDFVNNFNVEAGNVHQIRVRLRLMSALRTEFEEVCSEIMYGRESESDESQVNRDTTLDKMMAFDNDWMDVSSLLEEVVEKYSSSTPKNNQENSQTNVRLPIVQLPEFSGTYKEWLPFYDAFNNIIHKNKKLDNCEKLHYIKSCLKGEASRSIESLTVSNSNYTAAWSLLQKRYKNTRLIPQQLKRPHQWHCVN